MHTVAVPVLCGIIINFLLQGAEANLALDFKVTRISASHKPANCNVANTTYSHGETFKLDCKTQCVCENGRHACSSLCPKEQLPAPEDTISCRSPRLVEVPGHCCKMWLCENPTADVYATCHNSSTSPWTPCSRRCGLGISTRFTTTTAGCNQLSNLRLCENRKCEIQQDNTHKPKQIQRQEKEKEQKWDHQRAQVVEKEVKENQKHKQKFLMKTKQLKEKLKKQQQKHQLNVKDTQQRAQHEHRIRKGHECRSLQRLGPARVRLGQCVSKKLYRPKICGRCHQTTKCCVPSVSTTIQVELLCPLNAMDPISFVQQQLSIEKEEQQQQESQSFYPQPAKFLSDSSISSSSAANSLTSLWDTHSLDAIDQEYLQSHQIQIANKFIAVEWILKCECTKTDNCQRIVNTTTATRKDNSHRIVSSSRSNINSPKYHDYDDNENVDTGSNLSNNNNNNHNMQNINYFKLNHNKNNNKRKHSMYYEDHKQKITAEAAATQIDKIPDDDDNDDNTNVDKHYDDGDEKMYVNEQENDADNDSDININNSYSNGNRNINKHTHRFNRNKQTKNYDKNDSDTNSNNNKKTNKRNNQNDVAGGGDDDENGKESVRNEEDIEEKEWSLLTPLLTASSSPSASSSSSSSYNSEVATLSSDEVQPDIIPYPPPPFSANKHTRNNNNKNKNNHNNNSNQNNNNNNDIKTNWIKEKFKREHSKQYKQQHKNQLQQQHQQQQYEHWLLQQQQQQQQYNNKPYQEESLAT